MTGQKNPPLKKEIIPNVILEESRQVGTTKNLEVGPETAIITGSAGAIENLPLPLSFAGLPRE